MYSYILLMLIFQIQCEWVEITQQYKRPMRPTHNHPILATVGKNSETRPTHLQTIETDDAIKAVNRPVIDTAQVNDEDRVNKRNRIYINHTLVDSSWDIDSVQNVPNNVKLKSETKIHEKYDVATKPTVADEIVSHKTKSKGEIIIIKRPKPDLAKNGATNTDKPASYRTTVAGHVVRVHPSNIKGATNKPKPIEEYRGPIEVLNLSDLEYTTAEGISNTELDKGIENTVKQKRITSSTSKKQELSKSEDSNYHKNSNPSYATTKQPPVFLGVTNMRRIDIIRSTTPTPIEEFDKYDRRTNKPTISPNPDSTSEKVNNRKGDTTIYTFPNLGHVKRVHIESNATRTTHKPEAENKYAVTELEDSFTGKREDIKNKLRIDNATIHRITTEKSLGTKPGKPTFENRLTLNQVPTVPNPEEVMLEEMIIGEEKHFDIKVHKVASIGTVNRVSNPILSTAVNKNKLDNQHSMKQYSTPTSEIETDEEVTVEDEESIINYNNINKNNYLSSTEEIPIPTTAKNKQNHNTATKRPVVNPNIARDDLYKPIRIREHIPEFVTKEDKFGKIEYESTSLRNLETMKTKQVNNKANTNKESQNNSAGEAKPSTQTNRNDDKKEKDQEDPLSNDRKNSAMENLIKFLKIVTEIITKNTRQGVGGKMRYLEDLRDTIMANIEERLEAEFPDDGPGANARRVRSVEPRGHVEFPSSEGALMTISFLTFAVFLIKLVLQVIQAYKNKTMMMMPTVVAAVGRAYIERSNRV